MEGGEGGGGDEGRRCRGGEKWQLVLADNSISLVRCSRCSIN